jgi:hypothetical protein
MPQILESFKWLTPEFKITNATDKKVQIKGVALKGNAVTLNNRKYLSSELIRSARTFNDTPVTINHGGKTTEVGKVVSMEYDDDDQMEYLAEVWRQPYVDMLREKSTQIKGVSIEADYLHLLCPKCNKRFYSEETWQQHMDKDEFVKGLPKVPHGIRGKGLSLVLGGETPGFTGSTCELWETAPHLLQLLETVVTTEKEKESYMSKIVAPINATPRVAVPIGTGAEIKNSDPAPPISPPSVEAKKPATPAATPKTPDVVQDVVHQTLPFTFKLAETQPPIAETVTLTLKESGLIPHLELIKEGTEYPTFDACVASGKSRQECAAMFDKVDERNKANEKLVEHFNKLVDEVNKPTVMAIPKPQLYNDAPIREMFCKVTEALNTLPKDDLTWIDRISNLEKQYAADSQTLKAENKQLNEYLVSLKADTANTLVAYKKEHDEFKENFKNTLAIANANVVAIEIEKNKLKETAQKLTVEAEAKTREAATLAETVGKLTVKVDNLNDGLKGSYKGKDRSLKEAESTGYTRDPLTGR